MFLDRLGDEFIQQFDKFILGSKSPQRFEIFNQMGVINALTQHRFFIIPSQFKEDLDKTQFAKPQDYVLETATQKALALEKSLLLQNDKDLVVCADTIIVFKGIILEKPKDVADAKRTLNLLSGQSHMVYTAVVIRYLNHKNERVAESFVEGTKVEFMELTDSMINAYVETGEPMNKAGSYGIQSRGGAFVKRIEGDYYNVVGFPFNRFAIAMVKIMDDLKDHGERPPKNDIFNTLKTANLDDPKYLDQINKMMDQWRDDMLDADLLTPAQAEALKMGPKMSNDALSYVKKNLDVLAKEFKNMSDGPNFDDSMNNTFKEMSKSIESVKDMPINDNAAEAMKKLNSEHNRMLELLRKQQERLKQKIVQDVESVNASNLANEEQLREMMKDLNGVGGLEGVEGVDLSKFKMPSMGMPMDMNQMNKMMADLMTKLGPMGPVDSNVNGSATTNNSSSNDKSGGNATDTTPDIEIVKDDEQKE